MEETKILISAEAIVNAPLDKIWQFWTLPKHIMQWNNSSDDLHTARAENDLQEGGKFLSRMEAKDGSFGFDFGGVYTSVKTNELIEYTLDDGRKVKIILPIQITKPKLLKHLKQKAPTPLNYSKEDGKPF